MKLSDWAKKQGIAYLTAYRWFKDGKLPVEAYQSESGTIIVKDDEVLEQTMANHSNSDQSSEVMSTFIKKTVEFSKNEASIEEFAAYILSNFSLKFSFGPEVPKYSKNKPKPEDIQKHFQQFMKKGAKPKANVFLEAKDEETIEDLVAKSDSLAAQEIIQKMDEGEYVVTPSPEELDDLLKLTKNLSNVSNQKVSGNNIITEGLISRTVDLNSTPQQINYTSSTGQTISDDLPSIQTQNCGMDYNNTFVGDLTTDGSFFTNANGWSASGITTQAAGLTLSVNTASVYDPNVTTSTSVINTTGVFSAIFPAANAFQPTKKELASATKLVSADASVPRKRGRKPSKNKSQQ